MQKASNAEAMQKQCSSRNAEEMQKQEVASTSTIEQRINSLHKGLSRFCMHVYGQLASKRRGHGQRMATVERLGDGMGGSLEPIRSTLNVDSHLIDPRLLEPHAYTCHHVCLWSRVYVCAHLEGPHLLAHGPVFGLIGGG